MSEHGSSTRLKELSVDRIVSTHKSEASHLKFRILGLFLELVGYSSQQSGTKNLKVERPDASHFLAKGTW